MIEHFLRRLTVRRRILGGFLIMVVLLALPFPLLVADRVLLLDRLREVSDVEVRAERLLLLASTRVASSRVNLARYMQDYVPSPSEAQDDIEAATQFLTEAQDLITSPRQKAGVSLLLAKLVDDRALISDIKAAREENQPFSRLLFDAYRLGYDIGQQIEDIVQDSEARVAAANESVYTETQVRLIILAVSYGVILIFAIVLAGVVARSITRPVAELRSGAETFRLGQLDVAIPITGVDELSLLAQAFNQLASQLSESQLELEQRVAQRTRDLERRSVQLEAAAQIAREAAGIRDVGQLLNETVQLISDRFGFYHAGIFLLDETEEYAVLRAASSEGGQRMLARGHRLGVGRIGIVGYAAGTGEPRIALHVGADAVYFDNPDLPLTLSEMALPLKARGEVIGVLDVQSTRAEAFTEEDMAILQTLADQVALAIENARLLQESRRALQELDAFHGRRVREDWQEQRARRLAAFRYTQAGVVPASSFSAPEAELLPFHGRPLFQQDGDRRRLIAPIRLREEAFGSIVLNQDPEQEPWSPEELAIVEEVSNQVALALENARLLETTQRRATQERLIGEITANIRESLDLDVVLQTAVREMGEALDIAEVQVRMWTGEASDETGE